MSAWHWELGGDCGTQHCWAGWAVHISGEKGYDLQGETCAPFAALCIMKKSCDDFDQAPNFYADDDVALDKIREKAMKAMEKKNDI